MLILDNDSLLNIFYLCRPILLDEEEVDESRILQGGEWVRERWWYKLVQVCRRWRYLILASPNRLGLCLVCTYGTPVADMLAHAPPLPLILDYVDGGREVTTEDEEGILLALHRRDRLRRIRLGLPASNLRTLLVAIDEAFPMLEYLYIEPLTKDDEDVKIPATFQAPDLRYLSLRNISFPIGSPLLTTTAGLATLSLDDIPLSAYFHPGDLLRRLSLMPQLETLGILFNFPVPNRDIRRQLSETPVTTHITLPNLRWFGFKGASAYLEALLPHITTPVLEKLQIMFYNQLTFFIPHLPQFMSTVGNFRFKSARFMFNDWGFSAKMYPREWAGAYALYMEVICGHLEWQVASAAQIFETLGTMFSAVEYLTVESWRDFTSLEWSNEADRTQWHELLRPFSNVKTLHVDDGLVKELSRALQIDDGESPMGLLPELKAISSGDFGETFTPFINARQNAGHPVILVRR